MVEFQLPETLDFFQHIEFLRKELAAWELERNEAKANVNWQFRTKDARVKRISLYPDLDSEMKQFV